MSVAVRVSDGKHRLARLVTEVMAPVVVVSLATVIVAMSAAGVWRGLLLGVVAAFFAVGLPYAVVAAGVRRGRVTDRHVSRREQRPAILGFGLGSICVGLLVMYLLDAPRDLFAMVAAMVVGLAVTLGISLVWKVSMHVACVAGAVAVLAVLVHPALFALAPLVVLTGWARVVLKDHTLAQVVVGGAVGAVIATLFSSLIAFA